MSKKIKIELTDAQLSAIIGMTDEISAMNGGGDDDRERIKWVRLVDRMLKTNGYRRLYK